MFRRFFNTVIPEAGRAEAGIWKKWMSISMIRGRRPQLQD